MKLKKASQLFKALSEETRLRIINLLINKEELCVCDIAGVLEITHSKASRHLTYLKIAGLVDDKREGIWMHYCLTKPTTGLQASLLRCLRNHISGLPGASEDIEKLEAALKEKTLVCS